MRDSRLKQAKSGANACKSELIGVTWCAHRGMWRARITLDGKRRHLGYSNYPAGAANMYDIAARDHGLPLNYAPGAAQRFRWHTRYT